MNKKKIIIIGGIVVVLIIALLAVLFVLRTPENPADDGNVNDNANIEFNANENGISGGGGGAGGGTPVGGGDNLVEITEEVDEIDKVIEPDVPDPNAYDRYDEVKARDTDLLGKGAAYPREAEDERILSNYDAAALKNTADMFIRAFLTYDATSLGNNGYKGSWTKFVYYDESKASPLLRQHWNDQWNVNCSTYPEIVSRVDNIISIGEPYVSHVTSDRTVAISMKLQMTHNQDEPGFMDWEIMQTCIRDYAVYFDSSGRIIDVRMQTSKTIA